MVIIISVDKDSSNQNVSSLFMLYIVFYVWRGLGRNEIEWTMKAETKRVEFLAAGKAVFWSAAGLMKMGTLDSFVGRGGLIFAFTLPPVLRKNEMHDTQYIDRYRV